MEAHYPGEDVPESVNGDETKETLDEEGEASSTTKGRNDGGFGEGVAPAEVETEGEELGYPVDELIPATILLTRKVLLRPLSWSNSVLNRLRCSSFISSPPSPKPPALLFVSNPRRSFPPKRYFNSSHVEERSGRTKSEGLRDPVGVVVGERESCP